MHVNESTTMKTNNFVVNVKQKQVNSLYFSFMKLLVVVVVVVVVAAAKETIVCVCSNTWFFLPFLLSNYGGAVSCSFAQLNRFHSVFSNNFKQNPHVCTAQHNILSWITGYFFLLFYFSFVETKSTQ